MKRSKFSEEQIAYVLRLAHIFDVQTAFSNAASGIGWQSQSGETRQKPVAEKDVPYSGQDRDQER